MWRKLPRWGSVGESPDILVVVKARHLNAPTRRSIYPYVEALSLMSVPPVSMCLASDTAMGDFIGASACRVSPHFFPRLYPPPPGPPGLERIQVAQLPPPTVSLQGAFAYPAWLCVGEPVMSPERQCIRQSLGREDLNYWGSIVTWPPAATHHASSRLHRRERRSSPSLATSGEASFNSRWLCIALLARAF